MSWLSPTVLAAFRDDAEYTAHHVPKVEGILPFVDDDVPHYEISDYTGIYSV